MKWFYDKVVDAASIQIIRDERQVRPVRTIDLENIHVLLDVDYEGNIVGIEMLGNTHVRTKLRDLGRYLKEEANRNDKPRLPPLPPHHRPFRQHERPQR